MTAAMHRPCITAPLRCAPYRLFGTTNAVHVVCLLLTPSISDTCCFQVRAHLMSLALTLRPARRMSHPSRRMTSCHPVDCIICYSLSCWAPAGQTGGSCSWLMMLQQQQQMVSAKLSRQAFAIAAFPDSFSTHAAFSCTDRDAQRRSQHICVYMHMGSM